MGEGLEDEYKCEQNHSDAWLELILKRKAGMVVELDHLLLPEVTATKGQK